MFWGRCITNTTNVTTTCYDTDGGTNYPVKGYVIFNLSNGTTLTYIDHCETPNVIFENLCLNNGVAFAIEYCTNLSYWGCSDGACINLPCGDTNGDTYVNNLDITRILNYLYKGGPAPVSMWSANVNGDSAVNAVDVSYLINYIYKGGAALKCAEINNGTQKNTDVTAGMNYNKVVSDFKKASSSPGLLKRVWDSLFGTKTGTGKVVTSFGNETCSDSDGGKSYYVKGTLNWQGQRYTDYCLSANITYGNLREFYCPAGNETSYFINYHCPNGCSNGVCKIVGKRCNFLTKIFGKCATPSVNTGVK